MRVDREMLARSYAARSGGGKTVGPALAGLGFGPSKFALLASAAVLGLSGAYLQQKGLPENIAALTAQMRALTTSEPRFIAPAIPFLEEELDPDDDAALRAGLAPTPEAPAANLALAAHELGLDLTGLKEALSFYKAGALAAGDAAGKTAKDPIVKAAIEWVALRTFPRESGFERLQAFMAAHPTWPAQDWLRRRSEEALFGDRKGASLIKSYFTNVTPQTAAGKLALARVLKDDGKTKEAAALVKTVWRNSDLNSTLESRTKADFGAFLDKSDHKYRADRFLYKEQVANAMRAAALAGPDVVALAKARAAVIAEAPSDKALAAVPAPLRVDAGYKFAMIQKLRRADKIAEAAAIMMAAPRDPAVIVDGDEWWVERRLLARKLLDQGDASTAYKICDEHAAASREMQIEAEFHAGWIALRFLNDPVRAAAHFDTLIGLAQTPMSQARAAYWRARAAEASSAPDAAATAEAFYQRAAAHSASYYGQLARDKLGLKPALIRMPEQEVRGEARNESVKVLELLYAIGEKSLANPLAVEAARNLEDPAQVAALATVVARQRDANISLTVGKTASQRGVALDDLAFPAYGVPAYQPLRNSADPSIVYSIARQESAFNTTAVSTAGAKGLMQMIAATARTTAQRAGVAFDEARLTADAAFNAQLGAAHLGDLLAASRGSYILTFAAYNAGGGRVKQWLDAYGDPRKPGVDPIDWVERIPFTETRNYVQRVLENATVYRARFAASAPVQKADATP
ncbi:Lytic transglycosylase catalytic [Methylocella silvestris BL2]|uniref:Lytic transglycosylase catalytic n=1 Tax=Methylocella silvestris (strain DSM 15510 / CIP 108128 / LMG 27833 / NCIMB 13906 / BL2) TaxID=395965 RepID=B8ESC9_METSB|nr:lytic transglycosylase domain-containing protein [Methylocella silvestris]ACK49819.1 Lytic transglycosylase catalytic [Methylocella silvestris BL2]